MNSSSRFKTVADNVAAVLADELGKAREEFRAEIDSAIAELGSRGVRFSTVAVSRIERAGLEALRHRTTIICKAWMENMAGVTTEAREQAQREAVDRLEQERLDIESIVAAVATGSFPKNSDFLDEQFSRSVARLRAELQLGGSSSISDGGDSAKQSSGEFVDELRISALRAIEHPAYDLSRLVAFCQELNTAYATGCYHATAMLTRAVLDHVPPIFGVSSFREVANNQSGSSRSFRELMQHLESSARKVADSHLHTPVRSSEALPTRTQVNVSQALDSLLSEIVRRLR